MSASAGTDSFDAVIIGTGQGGVPLATALAGAGWRTAIVEREQVGGSCINYGCTPTKTMIASARVAELARRASEYGVHTGDVRVDMKRVIARKREIVEQFRDGDQSDLEEQANLTLVFGEASFAGPRELDVALTAGGVRRLRAERIFVNTGTRARRPPVKGLEGAAALDNKGILELEVLPEHLVCFGGSYLGIEFGQMFRRFGSRVTIVQRDERLFSKEDADVCDEVEKILREDGIEILTGSEPTEVRRAADEKFSVAVRTASGERMLDCTHILLGAGREPNTDRLKLERAGVRTDARGYIQVDERLETSTPGIFALGDVNGGPAFTHISYDDYRILEANLLQDGRRTTRDRLVPYTMFMDPELGRVGLSESEARALGKKIRVAKLAMDSVARAIEMGETRGFMKVVVDAESELILGAAILGVGGGEIMSIVETAMIGKLSYTALRDGVFAHPTLAEALNNLFYSWEDESGGT